MLVVLLSACAREAEHWDGSPYAGRPVFGSGAGQGVSQSLHDDAQKCGIEDETIEQAMQGSPGLHVVDIHSIFQVGGGAADVEMTSLGGGIWELQLTCK